VNKGALKSAMAPCLALLLCAANCSGGGNSSAAPKTITIGVDLPLTGPSQRAGQSTLNGVRFFVQRHQTLDGFNITIDARESINKIQAELRAHVSDYLRRAQSSVLPQSESASSPSSLQPAVQPRKA